MNRTPIAVCITDTHLKNNNNTYQILLIFMISMGITFNSDWYGFIYKTTNLVNEKIYVGKRKYLVEAQSKEFYLGSGKLLYNAIQKYGVENFKREIIVCCKDLASINEQERYWIKYFDSRNLAIGYNLAEGGEFGEVTWDHLPDKEERLKSRNLKIKNALTGVPQTEERVAQKSSNWHKQPKCCCVFCKREFHISVGKTHVRFCLENPNREIRKQTEEWKRKVSLKLKGKKHSEEYKALRSQLYKDSYPKKICKFCSREFPVNMHQRHENKCKENG